MIHRRISQLLDRGQKTSCIRGDLYGLVYVLHQQPHIKYSLILALLSLWRCLPHGWTMIEDHLILEPLYISLGDRWRSSPLQRTTENHISSGYTHRNIYDQRNTWFGLIVALPSPTVTPTPSHTPSPCSSPSPSLLVLTGGSCGSHLKAVMEEESVLSNELKVPHNENGHLHTVPTTVSNSPAGTPGSGGSLPRHLMRYSIRKTSVTPSIKQLQQYFVREVGSSKNIPNPPVLT